MTFEEIEDKLPNGFHDAEIRNIGIDFVGHSITIGMNLHVSEHGDVDSERYRPGTLTVVSPYLFYLEAPDPRYPFVLDGSPINASSYSIEDGKDIKFVPLLQRITSKATAFGFFLDDWNSYFNLAGASVEFSWDDGGS